GRGVEAPRAAEPRLARRAPGEAAGARVEGVDVAVVGADEDAAAAATEGERALHRPARLERPAPAAGAGVDRAHGAGPVADEDEPVRDERGRLGRAERRAPADPAVRGVEGVELAAERVGARVAIPGAVEERLVQHAMRERGRRPG